MKTANIVLMILLASLLMLAVGCNNQQSVQINLPSSNSSNSNVQNNGTQNAVNTSQPSLPAMNETQANGTATVENQTSQQESGETLPVTPPATVENESTQEQQQTVPPETQTDETQGSGSSSNSEYVGVKSSELGTYFRDQMNICYYNRELKKGDDIKIDSDGTKFVFSLVDFKLDDPDYTYKLYNQDKSQSWDIHDWAQIKVNEDKTVLFPAMTQVDITLDNGQSLSAALIRGAFDQINLCINTDEDYNIDFCNKLSGSEKEDCFGNLGVLYGESYCSKISDPTYQDDCIYGANHNNENV